jgi:hypothetical protein
MIRDLWERGLGLPRWRNRRLEIAAEIAQVYQMPESTCGMAWPGCQESEHACARRIGHDGQHRCGCGTPYANGNGKVQRAWVRRRWRDR